MKVIKFKSLPHFFFKEMNGAKPNTVQVIEENDPRFEALDGKNHPSYIQISNAENPQFKFKRKITDISFYRFGGWNTQGIWIISWKHQPKKGERRG